MDKFIKLNSNSSAPFTQSNNIVDFTVPEGIYNFKDSYVNLQLRITGFKATKDGTTEETPQENSVVMLNPVWASSGSEETYYSNMAVVKNARMSSAMKGQLEDVRRVDVLINNLKKYSNFVDKFSDENYKSVSQISEPRGNSKYGYSAQINKEGTLNSVQKDEFNIKIPLSDMFGLGSVREIDVSKTGKIHISLELRPERIQSFKQYPQDINDAPSANQIYNATDIGASEASINQLVISNVLVKDIHQSPYYVGMPILVSATGGAVSPATAPANLVSVRAVITNILHLDGTQSSGTSGQITLTLSNSVGATGAGQKYTAVKIVPEGVMSVSSEISGAEIVLASVGNPSGINELNYLTYTTEEGNGFASTSFHKQFQLEPNALSTVMMFPDGTDDLNSANDNLQSYRTRTDNEDNTDRDVEFGRPLEDLTLKDGLANMGIRYRCYRKSGFSTKSTTYGTAKSAGKRLHIITDSHPATNQEKLYQVNIQASAGGVNHYVLYKQIPRVLSY